MPFLVILVKTPFEAVTEDDLYGGRGADRFMEDLATTLLVMRETVQLTCCISKVINSLEKLGFTVVRG